MKFGARILVVALACSAIAASFGLSAAQDANAPVADKQAKAKPWEWAFQPLALSGTPQVKQAAWVRTPVDAYVLARLEEKNLKPSAEADRAALIRRATLDVWGVIPSPEAVDAFVKDRSPDAYEKLVDRLLASPAYGEREARRWLDLARYADSSGFQNDNVRSNMWRYRDWVINAFNQDKPYDQFVKEQLAGDELHPNDKNALIATGFLANYPDNYNARDLLGRRYQIITNMTDTVGSVFLAQPVECARCHDHKTDKVSQKEYFQLQSFFANVSETSKLAADVGEYERAYQAQQAKWEEATRELRAQRKAILDPVRKEADRYYRGRYLTDGRDLLFLPDSENNALARWVKQRASNVITEGNLSGYIQDNAVPGSLEYKPEFAEQWKHYSALDKEIKKFDSLKPKSGSLNITTITELGHPDAPATYVLAGGDSLKPKEEVQPGIPALFNPAGLAVEVVPTATSSGRRTALANWITDKRNPLPARVFVNRVWAQYFGKGIVETVSNFGRAGAKPTNPALLDYLADSFVKEGWSIKKLHRQILLSSVYRQASDYRQDAYKADPDNQLLAVFPRRRLDAEQIRDSLLVASGKFVDKVGGPSVFPPLPRGFEGDDRWEASANEEDHNRRSLYVFVRRSLPYPLLETFDMASSQVVHSKRDVTTTSLQSLNLFNDKQVYEWSKALARRVASEAGSNETAQLDRLYRILYSRAPDQFEKDTARKFLDHQSSVLAQEAARKPAAQKVALNRGAAEGASAFRETAFINLTHTLANANEFVYRY